MSLFGKDTYNYINNEIDYDKLAEAIVKAQKSTEEKQCIKDNKTKIYVSLMAVCVTIIFVALFILCIGFFIFGCMILFELVENENWNNMSTSFKIAFGVEYGLILIAILFFGVSFMFAAVEIYKEKDRDFVMSSFSSVIGFAAFIVSLIALFQSNGNKEIIPYLQNIIELLSK